MTKTLECDHCGAPHEPEDERCEYCGRYFDKKKETKSIDRIREKIIPVIMPRSSPFSGKEIPSINPEPPKISWYVPRDYEKRGYRIFNSVRI